MDKYKMKAQVETARKSLRKELKKSEKKKGMTDNNDDVYPQYNVSLSLGIHYNGGVGFPFAAVSTNRVQCCGAAVPCTLRDTVLVQNACTVGLSQCPPLERCCPKNDSSGIFLIK
jgi:hypothetical protein